MPQLHDENKQLISAVITCYFEEKTIGEFHSSLSQALRRTGRPYEIIFVNDGSTDGTLAKLKQLFDADPNVATVLDLFKNSGQAAAVTAGIACARGDVILSMDSDLQLDPGDLPLLLAEHDKGYSVVSGYRLKRWRNDSILRLIPSAIANMIMRHASDSKLRDFGCTFKLYDAKLIRAFDFGPFNLFNPVTVIAKAQRCTEVPVSHFRRKHGRSGWTFKKLWAYQMEHMVSLSERPFQYVAAIGLGFSALVIFRLLADVFWPVSLFETVSNGLILNILAIVFLVLLAVMCMVGEFSIRAFLALEKRPGFIVREVLARDSEGRVLRD